LDVFFICLFWIDLSLPGFLRLNFGESLILGKVVGSGGAGDLYAAEVINQSLIDRFNEKYVVVKYVKGIFYLFFLILNDRNNDFPLDIPGQQEEKSLQYFHDEVAINWLLLIYFFIFFLFFNWINNFFFFWIKGIKFWTKYH